MRLNSVHEVVRAKFRIEVISGRRTTLLKKVTYRGYVHVKRRLIVADPSKDGTGYSWTLAAAFGEMLLCAEEKFGPHDKEYTLLGIDFTPDGARTWTPGNCGHIIIQLDMNALSDRLDAYRQLAHECIHLISPTGRADANVLEEGLAVYFERWYMNHIFGQGWWSGPIDFPIYAHALAAAERLLTLDPNVIKKIRKHQPVIAKITAEQIMQHCPDAPSELAFALAAPFVRAEEGYGVGYNDKRTPSGGDRASERG